MTTFVVGTIIGGAQAFLEPHHILFLLYLIMNLLDLIAGALAAYSKDKFSCRELVKGIARKVGYWIMVTVSFIVSMGLETIGGTLNVDLSFIFILGWVVLSILLVNEARSILQKLVVLGVHVPPVLESMLQKASGELEAKYQGTMIVNTTDPEKDVFRFELDCNPAELANKSEIRFKVRNEDANSNQQ